MTLHVSLPKELENLVHSQVESGMYGSASEVVRQALRDFFSQDRDLSFLRQEVEDIQKRLNSGEEKRINGEAFFSEMEEKYGHDE